MAAYDISKITIPSGDELNLKDGTARSKIGNTDITGIGDGSLTGAVRALADMPIGSLTYDGNTGHLIYVPYSET